MNRHRKLIAAAFVGLVFSVAAGYLLFGEGSPSDKSDAATAAIPPRTYDDKALWAMSHDPAIVARGELAFKGTCATCHGTEGEGIWGLGVRLNDDTWVHGTEPVVIFDHICNGIRYEGKPTKMLALGYIGEAKIADIVAFLLSKQTPGKMRTIPRSEEPSQH